MAIASNPSIACELQRLFDGRAVAALGESQLLDRFVATGDSAAFEALVLRYGPMVLGACRSVLRDPHDVEDAFQATFLVLVRKAGAIREPRLLGCWLHRIAIRVSVHASKSGRRKRRIENSGPRAVAQLAARPTRDVNLADAIHGELDRLPEKYRAPVVLCYLEGQTHEAAAQSLNWPLGTVKGRLARARSLLRDRLTRRGIGVSSAGLSTYLTGDASAKAPPCLFEMTCQAARALAMGQPASATISATAFQLMKGALRTMMFRSLRAVMLVFVSAAALAAGSIGLGRQISGNPPGAEPSRARLRSYTPGAPERDPATHVAKSLDAYGAAGGRVVKTVPISKDCMVLAYLPAWAHGNVDNLGLANNGGGVRALLDWHELAPEEVAPKDRQFLLALYARQTTSRSPVGPILGFNITALWPELTSWKTMPPYAEDAAISLEFAPGEGWKLFDVTPLVRARIRDGRKGYGILLRFLNEDHVGTNAPWSGYSFVSREGDESAGERRPVLLVVEPDRK